MSRPCRTSGIDALEYIGRAVQKEFAGFGIFKGKVIDFDRINGFKIEYEDGDCEDVTQQTLEKLLASTPKEEPKLYLYGTSDMPKRTTIPSSTVSQYCTNAKAAARRKRKHTELKRSGILERKRLECLAAAARTAAPKERVTLHPRPSWAEGLCRESKALQCDATQVDEPKKRQAARAAENDCSLYRLRLEVNGPDSVSVQWWFPPANPGSQNAWLALFLADHVQWREDSGEVGSGTHKLSWRCITADRASGTMKFARLFAGTGAVPDGEYVFTLQPDYGTVCKAVSERFRVRDRRIVAVVADSALVSDAGLAVHRHHRQQSASLGLITVQRAPVAPADAEVEDERCYFPVHSVHVSLGEQYMETLPLLKDVYRIVDKESYLDWGLTSDYLGGEPEADEEAETHRLRKKAAAVGAGGGAATADARPVAVPSGYSAQLPAAAQRTKRGGADGAPVRGLGGGTLGSEGYGEATTGSAHRIGVLLQNLRQLVLRDLSPHVHWGLLWDLGPPSTLLDIGAGYGKVVLHLRLLAGMRRSVGVECVASRVHIANKALYNIEVEGGKGGKEQKPRAPGEQRKRGFKGLDVAHANRAAKAAKAKARAAAKAAKAGAADVAMAEAGAEAADAETEQGEAGGEEGEAAGEEGEPVEGEEGEEGEASCAGAGAGAGAGAARQEDDAASAASSASTDAAPPPDEAPAPVVPWVAAAPFAGVEFELGDATKAERLNYTHIYIFDWVFSKHTLHAVAEVLQRSPFYVMMSTRKPAEWWSYGLVKAQPVCKLSGFRTTGGEGMTLYVYINLEKVPQ